MFSASLTNRIIKVPKSTSREDSILPQEKPKAVTRLTKDPAARQDQAEPGGSYLQSRDMPDSRDDGSCFIRVIP
jgi:hypothetical protein